MFCLGPQRVHFSSSSSIKYLEIFTSYISALNYWLSVPLKTLTVVAGWLGIGERGDWARKNNIESDPSESRQGSESRRLQRNGSESQRDLEICVSNGDTSR